LVVLDGDAAMLDIDAVMLKLVFVLPPLTAATCVLRLLQKYLHHAAYSWHYVVLLTQISRSEESEQYKQQQQQQQ
jgi:hypothetical protein